MRIVVTGRDGQVGWELCRTLAPLGEVMALSRVECDLSRPTEAAEVIRNLAPDLVVNAAAYTAVDRAESEPGLAQAVNADAVGAIAAALAERGAALIHYSTDYVFDGSSTRPYLEDDAVGPIGVYGATKQAGEQAIRASGVRHLILRTCWVYGARGKNFLLTMLRLANERDGLKVVGDQLGCPTSSRMIAEATALLVARGAPAESDTVNLSCGGQASWHAFASRIVAQGAARGLCREVPVQAIGTADYPTPARRPAYSVLDPQRLATRYRLSLPGWEQALDLVLDELKR